MADTKKMIELHVANKKVMVFSKSWCGFCAMAKKVLQEYINNGVLSEDDYEVMEIDNRGDMNAIQDQLRALTGARSVPRVFINGKCIGGGDETAALHRSGKLKPMLTA